METLLVIWIMCAVACAVIASNKGRNPFAWAIIGFFTGLLGLIVICALSRENQA